MVIHFSVSCCLLLICLLLICSPIDSYFQFRMWRVDPITKNSQRDHRISRRSTSQCNRCMCIETSISDVLLTVKKISRGWDIETCCTVKLPKRIVPINHREHRHGKVSLGLTSHVFYKVEPLFILFRVTLILIHRWLSCFEMG